MDHNVLHPGDLAIATHLGIAGVDLLDHGGHTTFDGHSIRAAVVESSPARAKPAATPKEPSPVLDLLGSGDGHFRAATQIGSAAPDPTPWVILRNAVEAHEAAMEYRKAFDNRARAWGESKATAVARSSIHEHETKLALNARHAYRECVPEPIRAWQAATPGLGEQGVARLLGHISHPAWKWVHEWQGTGRCICNDGTRNPKCTGRHLVLADSSPRTFGQLVAYAGLVPGRQRSKGMSAEDVARCGAPTVGPILHSLADAAGIKIKGPLRDVYDAARATYAERDDWTVLHQHNAALRIVKREILRGLWLAAQPPAEGS